MQNTSVPFNDLSRIHKPIEDKVINKIKNIVKKNSIILGEFVEEFEENFSNFTNSKYSISCGNGTDAIELVLRSLGIKAGDEVIVPSYTFIATATAVVLANAVPVFADISIETGNINPRSIESLITNKTNCLLYTSPSPRD